MKLILRRFTKNRLLNNAALTDHSIRSKCRNPRCARLVDISLINPQKAECWYCARSCYMTETGVVFRDEKTVSD